MGNFGFPKRTFTHLHNSLEENECHEKSIMASMATDTNTTITCCLKIDDKKMLLLEINNDEIMKLTVALTDAHNIYTVHIRHVNYRCNSTKIASRYFCLLYSMPFFCFIFMCVCFFLSVAICRCYCCCFSVSISLWFSVDYAASGCRA